jgi:hypothetical protein
LLSNNSFNCAKADENQSLDFLILRKNAGNDTKLPL